MNKEQRELLKKINKAVKEIYKVLNAKNERNQNYDKILNYSSRI